MAKVSKKTKTPVVKKTSRGPKTISTKIYDRLVEIEEMKEGGGLPATKKAISEVLHSDASVVTTLIVAGYLELAKDTTQPTAKIGRLFTLSKKATTAMDAYDTVHEKDDTDEDNKNLRLPPMTVEVSQTTV